MIVDLMKLTYRVWGILLFGLLGISVLSFTFYWGEHKTAAISDKAAKAEELVAAYTKTEAKLREISSLTEQFLLTNDLAAVDRVAHVAALNDELRKKLADQSSSIGKLLEKAAFDVNEIVAARKVAGLSEKEGLKGELRTAVKTVEGKLKEFGKSNGNVNLDKAMVAMLMLRRHEKDYMLRNQSKYVDKFNQRIDEFFSVLSEPSIPADLRNDITPLMKDYQAKFTTWVAANTKVLGKLEVARTDIGGMILKLVELEEEAEAHFKSILIEKHEVEAFVQMIATIIIAITSILFLSGGYLVIRSITVPIREVTSAMSEITKGNLHVEIPAKKQNDEIGKLCDIAEVLRDSVRSQREHEAEEMEKQKQAEAEKRRMMVQLADDFDRHVSGIVSSVSTSSQQLNNTAGVMSAVADKTSNEATSASAASQQTLNNVQTVASATEEMSGTFAEMSHQITVASDAAQEAVGKVGETSQQVQSLAEIASRIGQVVEMISSIAEQTNLLALNATIESARAGEAGKGFAVVAGEVKDLAGQTSKATEEIASQISEIQTATQRASHSMEDVNVVIQKVEEISSAIAAAMEEQNSTTQEIASNVHQAANGSQLVNDNVINVTQASQEASAASGEVMQAAQSLGQQAEILQTEVGNFIARVRAS